MDFSDFDTSAIWLPFVASILTGALIGFERELKAKAAGLRTHTLVCFSSALLMILASQQDLWVFDAIPGANLVSDPARMAHGIITGMGFLGAGVIFRQGVEVQGLTTAASLWLTAALGIVYGAGLFWLGVTGTVVTLVVLVALRLVTALMPERAETELRISTRLADGPVPRDILDLLGGYSSHVGPPALRLSETDGEPRRDLVVTIWLAQRERIFDLMEDLSRLSGLIRVSTSAPDQRTDPWA